MRGVMRGVLSRDPESLAAGERLGRKSGLEPQGWHGANALSLPAFARTLHRLLILLPRILLLLPHILILILYYNKSTHIPYRDSKLTRILQESIGGNSRTTLIVNCSPSPSNESETLSTLRFGVRAKTIRNKAKVNVEMSPTELKNLLKRVKASLETEQTYAKALEGEIGVWRSGATVPESEWVQRSAFAGASAEAANSKSVATTSSLTAEANTSSSISTPPVSSVASTRAEPMPLSKIKSSNSLFALSTGSLFDRIGANMPQETMTEDERDEFLRIQNELSDTLVEAQRTLKDAQTRVETMEEEIEGLRREHAASGEENRKMGADLSKLKLDLERVACENKENIVVAENLKEQNQTMVLEIKSLKVCLLVSFCIALYPSCFSYHVYDVSFFDRLS